MSVEAAPVVGRVAESARLLNDTIAKGAKGLGVEEIPVDFFCECGNPECRSVARLTVAQYHDRRAAPVIAHSGV